MEDDEEIARRQQAALEGGVRETVNGAVPTAVPVDAMAPGALQSEEKVAVVPAAAEAVDEREVLFLIANYLEKRSESKHAAQALIRDLSTSDLLGESVSWTGRSKHLTYADYKRRHRDLGPDHLLHILKGALTAKSAVDASAGSVLKTSNSLLLKSRVTVQRKPLLPAERKAMQTEIIDKTMQLRKLQRTERLVKRIVSKYDRLLQFLEDAKLESLPWDVRNALEDANNSSASVNVTALAADVRAVRQLIQVREEKVALQEALYKSLERAKDVGAMQTTARRGRNHLSLLHRREVSRNVTPQLPPSHIYSRFRRLKTLNGHLLIPAYCMTYDKTGKLVITGADDRLIKIWSLETGDLRFSLRGHVGNITDLAVNQSNTLLASSSDDKTVRVWELSTGAPVAVLLGHTSVVNSVRFHPKMNIVVTASDDGHCFCYKLPDIAKFDEPESKEQTAKRLYDQAAYLLTLRPAFSLSHAPNKPNVRSNKVLCLNFSRCGNFVVTGGQDGVGRVWDVSELSNADGNVVATDFRVPPHEVPAVAVPEVNAAALEEGGGVLPHLAQLAPAPPIDLAPANQQDLQIEVQGVLDMFPAPVMEQLALAPAFDAIPDVAPPPPQVQVPLLPELAPVAEQQALLQAPLLPPVAADGGEQRQQPQLAEVPQTRQVEVDINQVKTITEPVAYLKGHTGPVTNILYSHKGDRIATASIKDGTTRVWQWEKKYKKVTHKVLVNDERDRERELAMLYGVASRKRTPPAVDTLVWTHDDKRLITLHSTKPDSGMGEGDWKQRMRIWDPMTGSLEMTLAAVDREKRHGHINAVFAMDVHPSDWRIVVTAGHDGRVFIWDISEGKILKSFVVTSPEGETVALLDGSFMPTGDGFCFTDRLGRLCIFGTGSGEKFAAVPVQQYFISDYAALITDRHFHVIDRDTQRNPSLMESGPLADIFRVEYPHQPPHLLASRGALTPEQYEENRRKRVQQCVESENTCKVRHANEDKALVDDDDFPVAILQPPAPLVDPTSSAPILASGSYRLNGDPVLHAEMMRRASWNRRQRDEMRSRRRTSPTVDDRDTSILNLEISSEDDHSDEDFQAPTNRRTGDDDDEDDDDEEDEDEEDEDLDDDDLLSDASDAPDGARLRRRRARQTERQPERRLPGRGRRLGGEDADEDEDDDSPGVRLRRRRAIARSRLIDDEDDEVVDALTGDGSLLTERRTRSRSRSHSVESADSLRGDPDGVVVESNDGFIMGDNQLDKFDTTTTYEEMLQAKQDQLAASGTSPPDTPLIVCALCNDGDDKSMLKLPGDAMGKHPLISASQRLFVHDQCAIASPLCFNRGGRWFNVTKEIRRGRSLTCIQCKKRGATIGCTIERCPKSYHWKCAVANGWSMNQIHFYCPEHAANTSGGAQGASGDREMQHRLGLTFHREWLQLSSLAGIHPYVPQTGDNVVYFPGGHVDFLRLTTIKDPAYLRQVSRFVTLKCRVTSVKYLFPSLAEYNHGDDGQKAIQCEVSLAILAVPTTVFPSLSRHEEEKEEKEESDDTTPAPDALFLPDAPFFSRFVSVNECLQPTEDAECKRLTIKVRMFSHDVSNFIVLDHAFEAGISGDWKVGQRVRAPYMELTHGLQVSSKMSFGTITKINVRPSVANPTVVTPWNSIFVQWDADDEEDCDVSPWELEPATAASTAVKKARERELVSVKLLKSRKLSRNQQQILSEALTDVMNLSIAKDFIQPVSSEYADYMVTVANPIDLLKIRARVQNGYYRQLDAFIADVELLHENCETYNVSTSPIAQNSRNILSSVMTTLQQHFPDFCAARAERIRTHLLPYPFVDFGSNDDEDDVVEVDESDFEPEGGRPVVPTPVARPITTEAVPEVAAPEVLSRSTRSSRAVTVEPTYAEEHETINEGVSSPPRRTRQAASVTAAATPERRVKREAPVVASPELSRSNRKRQRPSDRPRVLQFPDVMNMLTVEQRELLQERATEDLLSLLRDFHEALMGADTGEIFASPVTDDIAPGYSDVIPSPMDFGTILDQIERYSSFTKYFEHVELVFTNAITYNSWDSEIGELVKELQGYYAKFLLDAIGITVKTKAKPRGGVRQTVHLHAGSPGRTKVTPQSKRKRRAISDDEDEESASSSSSSSSASSSSDEDEEEAEDSGSADEEEDDSEPESDSSGAPRRRQISHRSDKKRAGKAKKSAPKNKNKNKRSRR